MVSEKKIEFLVKQGFDKDTIKLFIECGVEKHLIWFLSMQKKGSIEYLNTEDIKRVDCYLEKIPSHKIKKHSYSEVLFEAKKFDKDEKRKKNNQIYHFKNGYYISILNSIDLITEGEKMSNCVGSYKERVYRGDLGLLALKQLNGKTVARIEINKNGLIGQNFSKANSSINKEHWMMILEFFEKNAKSVDLSKLFGESHIATCYGGNINEVILTVPTNINVFIENGVKKSEQNRGYEVKRFSTFHGLQETAVKLSSKDELIEWIEHKKIEIIKAYEELLIQVIATKASKLYLSDNIKEKIFGNKKGSYKMKGEEYNLSEIDPTYGMEKLKNVEIEPEEMELEAEMAPMVNDPRPEPEPQMPVVFIGRRRPQVNDEVGEDEPIEEDGGLKKMIEDEMIQFEIEEKILEFEANERGEEKERETDDVPGGELLPGRRNPQQAVEEIAYDDEYEAIAEDIDGNVYGIDNMREQQVNYIEPPENFNEIMRRAVRG